MGLPDGELDITKKVRTIEWLKSELLDATSKTFRALMKGKEEHTVESLANVLISTYLLSKRLGIDFHELDHHLTKKLQLSIEKDHELENWYGDLTALLAYIKKR